MVSFTTLDIRVIYHFLISVTREQQQQRARAHPHRVKGAVRVGARWIQSRFRHRAAEFAWRGRAKDKSVHVNALRVWLERSQRDMTRKKKVAGVEMRDKERSTRSWGRPNYWLSFYFNRGVQGQDSKDLSSWHKCTSKLESCVEHEHESLPPCRTFHVLWFIHQIQTGSHLDAWDGHCTTLIFCIWAHFVFEI